MPGQGRGECRKTRTDARRALANNKRPEPVNSVGVVLHAFIGLQRSRPPHDDGEYQKTWGGASMLILTRRVGETIMVGDDVRLTVLGVKGSQVRVGINAPKHIAVHREEIYARIQATRAVEITEAGGDTFSSVILHR